VSQRSDLLFELFRDRTMAGKDIERADLAGLIIRGDVDDCDAFRSAAQALAFIQSVMLRLRREALAGYQALAMRLERLEKNVSTVA